MEFSWSTFLLEIINFLVLVWILKRFLYKPVLGVIARRRADIEDRLTEARHLHDEADALKAEYENRLEDWDRERRQARDTLARELDEERTQQMQALRKAMTGEREKAHVADSRRRIEAQREIEHSALQQGAQFATRLLTQAAGPELETKLLDVLLDGMSGLSSNQIAALRTQWGEPPDAILVVSAYPLPEDRRKLIEETLTGVTGLTVPVRYARDPDLLAGLRITIGAWTLHANVKDELKGFAALAHAER